MKLFVVIVNLMLHALEFPNAFAELDSFFEIRQRFVETSLGEADHLRRNSDATFVQHADRVLVAVAKCA